MTAKEYREKLYFIIRTMEISEVNEFNRGYIQGLTFALSCCPDSFDAPVNKEPFDSQKIKQNIHYFDEPVNKELFDFNKIKTNYIVKHKEHGYGNIEVITIKNEKPSSFLVHYENGRQRSYHKEDIHCFDKIGPWEGDEIK